jgi:TPR repeat protein
MLGVGALLAVAAAWAGAPEEHRRGLAAYQRGDVAGAMAALRAPAQAGHAPSQSLLGYILERADFSAEAAALWQQAAAQGDAEAHAGLANLCLTGRGLAKDEKAALRHFSEAAERGHAASIEALAQAWLKGELGADARAAPAAARAAIEHAAEQGHLPSAAAMATAYRQGDLGLPRDQQRAAAWAARAEAWRQQRAAASAPGVAKGGL